MYEEREEQGKGLKVFLIITFVVIAILTVLWSTGLIRLESTEDETEQEVAGEDADFSFSEEDLINLEVDLRALQREVKQLKSELAQTKSELEQLKKGSSKSTTTRTSTTAQRTATSQNAQTTAASENTTPSDKEQSAITMVQYSHDAYTSSATITLQNNTNKTITGIKWRMVYYDMKENMLDYQDFTRRVSIDPGMVKKIEVSGYNDRSYYYYKSHPSTTYPERKYKVKFELKDYQ